MSRKRITAERTEHAGLYVRVSLDRSARGMQDEILSPETQEDRSRQYCGAQGWTVAAVERDIDESGYRQHYSQREGLMRLLGAVERGELTKVIVWKFSRLSRRLREFIEICDKVEAAGGGVVSVTEQVDTSTPAGRLIRNILASFAQFQSEEISEQIFETWMTKARRGERPAGLSPFGTVNKRGVLEPNPAEHTHLLAMYRTFVATRSIKAVWDYLAGAGVPAPKAAGWNLNTIRGILTNPVYIGRLEWAGETFDAKWEPFVPLDLWEEVQSLLHSRRQGPVVRKDARGLNGVIRCGMCGRPMWTRYGKRLIKGRSEQARLYACVSPQNNRHACAVPTVHAEEAEEAVWQAVMALARSADLEAMITARARAQMEGDPDEAARRRHQLHLERERTEKAAGLLFDLVSDASITREQFRQRNLQHIERLREIEAELAGLPRANPGFDLTAMLAAARSAMAAQTEAERRDVLRTWGAAVRVTEKRVVLEFLGLRINLRARRVGATWHFGPQYQRLDYRGPLFTDRQIEFIRRTYGWADKRKVAARLGRHYMSLVQAAQRLRREGILSEVRS